MTTQFDTPLIGFRYVPINQDDTLQAIALRELGDAARWPELIYLNDLLPPFITSDPAVTAARVLHPGDLIMVPASSPAGQAASSDAESVLLTDVHLANGRLDVANGDLAVVSGSDNLKQALTNALATDQGELMFYPDYGSLLRRLIGRVNSGAVALLAAEYARDVVEADPRVDSVVSSTAQAAGPALQVTVTARSILGRQTPVDVTL